MRKEGALSANIEVTVAFHDIDVIGVVWHGHYLKYLENARWSLMDRIGFGYETMRASGYAWPIVEMHVKYVQAAKLGDRLSVRASLVEWQNRVVMNYLITRVDGQERLARAKSVQVAVDSNSTALHFVTPSPLLDRVHQALGALPAGGQTFEE